MRSLRSRTWPATIFALALLLAGGVGLWVLVGGLIGEWRSAAAFWRYKNWKGQWVSHADLLIFGAVTLLAMGVGALWSFWDRGSERRMAKKIARDRRTG